MLVVVTPKEIFPGDFIVIAQCGSLLSDPESLPLDSRDNYEFLLVIGKRNGEFDLFFADNSFSRFRLGHKNYVVLKSYA